jgi:CRISPR-associated exonuclease Cas4
MNLLLPAALFLFLLAVIFFVWAARRQKSSGLPAGRVIYADTSRWQKIEKPYYDALLGLTGRPDYVVEHRGALIPVEVKSAYAPDAPYESHIMQLMSYCLLLEKTTGQRPPFGILHYSNRTFALDYTQDYEARLLDLLVEMRRAEHSESVACSHEEPQRCLHCGYREICGESLVDQ